MDDTKKCRHDFNPLFILKVYEDGNDPPTLFREWKRDHLNWVESPIGVMIRQCEEERKKEKFVVHQRVRRNYSNQRKLLDDLEKQTTIINDTSKQLKKYFKEKPCILNPEEEAKWYSFCKDLIQEYRGAHEKHDHPQGDSSKMSYPNYKVFLTMYQAIQRVLDAIPFDWAPNGSATTKAEWLIQPENKELLQLLVIDRTDSGRPSCKRPYLHDLLSYLGKDRGALFHTFYANFKQESTWEAFFQLGAFYCDIETLKKHATKDEIEKNSKVWIEQLNDYLRFSRDSFEDKYEKMQYILQCAPVPQNPDKKQIDAYDFVLIYQAIYAYRKLQPWQWEKKEKLEEIWKQFHLTTSCFDMSFYDHAGLHISSKNIVALFHFLRENPSNWISFERFFHAVIHSGDEKKIQALFQAYAKIWDSMIPRGKKSWHFKNLLKTKYSSWPGIWSSVPAIRAIKETTDAPVYSKLVDLLEKGYKHDLPPVTREGKTYPHQDSVVPNEKEKKNIAKVFSATT